MDIEAQMRQRGEFPTDHPLDALRTDHSFVRQLFDSYFQARDEGDRKEFGEHILSLLEMHTSLEENVFYPRVHALDPALVDRCGDAHGEARGLIEMLKLMNESDPRAESLFRNLSATVMRHVEEEEQQLFEKVEQSNLDMAALGRDMQDFEIRMIAAHAQRPPTPGLRL